MNGWGMMKGFLRSLSLCLCALAFGGLIVSLWSSLRYLHWLQDWDLLDTELGYLGVLLFVTCAWNLFYDFRMGMRKRTWRW